MRAERKQRMETVLNQRQADLVVVLENIRDPHNIGAVFRSAESVGVQDIYIINTLLKTDEFDKKKSSGSAEKWLQTHHFDNTLDCVTQLKIKGFELWSTHLNSQSVSLYEVNMCQKIALVFGAEKVGISQELLAHCDGNFIIPQIGMVQSLNISVACAISLYEAYRQRSLNTNYKVERLNQTEKNQIYQKWTERYQD